MTTATAPLFSSARVPGTVQRRRTAAPAQAVQAAQLHYPWMTAAIRRNLSTRALRLMRSGD